MDDEKAASKCTGDGSILQSNFKNLRVLSCDIQSG
jgi:hypothetical protein